MILPKPGKAIDFEEIRAIEKDILADFWAYCQKHRLRMWLAYGSLIGAVRHQDMIPWDDDIDLVMYSEEFHALVDIAQKNNGMINDHIRLVTPAIDSRCPVTWAKLVDVRTIVQEDILKVPATSDLNGVWVDIFPLYPVKHSALSQKIGVTVFDFLYLMMRVVSWKHLPASTGRKAKFLAKLLKPCAHLIGYKAFGVACAAWLRFWFRSDKRNKQVFSETSSHYIFDCDLFDQRPIMLKFGEHSYPAPGGFDDFLRICYGDYMQIPPKEEQHNHPMTAHWV